MILSARTAAFFFLNVCTKPYTLNTTELNFPTNTNKKENNTAAAAFYPPPFLLSKKRG